VSEIPSRLFKYFPPERIDGLLNQELAFSPLSAFNDPFEGKPEITGLSDASYFKKEMLKNFGPVIEEKYLELPQQDRARISLEVFSAMMWGLAHNELDSNADKYLPLVDELARTFPEHLNKQIGVLCLCEVPDSLLMWAHYARSHSGFIVEYDAEHSFFDCKRGEKDEFNHLRRVLYRSARPSAKLMEMEGPEFFLVKSDHWLYEHEWRILRPLSEAARTLENNDGIVHLFNYPGEIVRRVILGARASPRTAEAIREVLSANPEYKSVQLQQAFPDPSHFLLRFRAV